MTMHIRPWSLTIVAGLALVAACGSDTPPEGAAASLPPPEPTCDAAGVIAALEPQIAYDYDPTTSAGELSGTVDVVFRAARITGVEADRDWATLTFADVETLSGSMPQPGVEPSVSIDLGGAGLVADAPAEADLVGLTALIFAYQSDNAPSGLLNAIEGVWIGCGDDTVAESLSVGAAWGEGHTITELVEAVNIGAPSTTEPNTTETNTTETNTTEPNTTEPAAPTTVPPPTTVADPDGASGAIDVRATQLACCYVEGSWSIIEITDAAGAPVAPMWPSSPPESIANEQFLTTFPRAQLAPGTYEVAVWQELCAIGCRDADEALQFASDANAQRADECRVTIELLADELFDVDARWAPGEGCSDVVTIEIAVD